MDAACIAGRIRDNLRWAHVVGDAPPPREPEPVWPQIKQIWSAPDGEFVRRLFHALLQREPDDEALEYFRGVLRAGGDRAEVVREIARGSEAKSLRVDLSWLPKLAHLSPVGVCTRLRELWREPDEAFVRGLYEVLLDRVPRPDELAFYAAVLSGGRDRAVVVRGVVESDEYRTTKADPSWVAKLPTLSPDGAWVAVRRLWREPDEGFVRGLYDLLLDRGPAAGDLAWHLANLAKGHDRADVIRGVVDSDEYRSRERDSSWLARLATLRPEGVWAEVKRLWPGPAAAFVRGLYDVLLGRDPGPSELSWHLANLADGQPRIGLVRALGTCEEYLSWGPDTSWLARVEELTPEGICARLRRLWGAPPEEFVAGLYELFLDRAPDREGLADHAGRVHNGLSRSALVREFALCEEALSRRVDLTWLEWLDRDAPFAPNGPSPRRSAPTAAFDAVALLGLPDESDFVRRAYRAVLGRDASEGEVARQVRRLNYLPGVYNRRQLLRRLRRSEEARQIRRRRDAERLQQLIAVWEDFAARTHRLVTDQTRALMERVNALHAQSKAELEQGRAADAARAAELAREFQLRTGELAERVGLAINQVETHATQRFERLWQELATIRADHRQQAEGLTQDFAEKQDRLREEQVALIQEQQRQNFEVNRSLEQLRRVAGSKPVESAPAPRPAPEASAGCRVCGGGPLEYRWSRRVLNDKYEAQYHECRACGTLQVPGPHWLAEAYSDEANPQFWNPDHGRFVRNFSVYGYLLALHRAGVMPDKPRLLDFGGGYGLLTQMLVNAGYDAWQADPYVPTPFLAPERMIPDLAEVPASSFDAVTAFEVLEHLTDPLPTLRELRRVLKPDGILVVSTEIYRPGVHGPDWHYLSCEAGQHVTFWTREGFRRLAAKLGFASVGYFPDSKGFCTILSARPAGELTGLLGRAAEALTDPAFLDQATRGWELTRCGALPAPAALADAAAEEGEPCAS